jgi:hypothetical protein
MIICEHDRVLDKCTVKHKEDYLKLLERCYIKGYLTKASYESEKENHNATV